MKRLIPIFALLFAVGASAYFIYLAQTNAGRATQGQVSQGDQPATVPSARPASDTAPGSVTTDAPGSATTDAPGSLAPEREAAPGTTLKPTFQGGSKAFAPSDGMIFQGGSKAAMIGTEGLGRPVDPQRSPPGARPGDGAAPGSDAPDSDAPAPAPNAPPSFMGGSKFDPGTLPLPKRP